MVDSGKTFFDVGKTFKCVLAFAEIGEMPQDVDGYVVEKMVLAGGLTPRSSDGKHVLSGWLGFCMVKNDLNMLAEDEDGWMAGQVKCVDSLGSGLLDVDSYSLNEIS